MDKKRAVILIIAILVILIPALIFIAEKNSQNVASTIHTSKTTTQTTPTREPTVDPAKYTFIQDNNYTLFYPMAWTQNKTAMQNKTGNVYLLQPQNTALPSHPHITVEIVDAKLDSIEHMTTEFRVFGYKMTTEMIKGTAATKYQRSISSKQGTLNSTAYIFQKDGKIYFFKLGYTQDVKDPQLEGQFQDVVTNFSIR